jgi:hypothetical protein
MLAALHPDKIELGRQLNCHSNEDFSFFTLFSNVFILIALHDSIFSCA